MVLLFYIDRGAISSLVRVDVLYRRIVVIALAALVGAGARSLCAQDTAGRLERLVFDVDYARFFGNDTLTYVELYYAVSEHNMTYRKAGNMLSGGINIYVTLKRNGEIVRRQAWSAPHTVADSSQITKGNKIVGLTSFALPVGTYECEVRVHDVHDPARSDTILFPLLVQGYPLSRVSLSDLELCTSIRRIEPDAGNVFYKNTLEVIPNVTAAYGSAVPVLYYYVEAYNLSLLQREHYDVRLFVHDGGGREVFQQHRTKTRGGNSSVEIGSIDVGGLFGGTYTLTFLLVDTLANVAYTSSKKFFVYKPGEPVQFPAVSGDIRITESEFAMMDDEELDADFAYAKYLATDDELKQYKSFSALTDEKPRTKTKRNFLFHFWRKREQGSNFLEKTTRTEYLGRIEYANERYSAAYRRGWQSDRGRVHVLYGEPNEIDRFPNTVDNNPYEIWTYHQIPGQGGAAFVFVDRTGYGDWVLVHSTHRNEPHDEGWERYVRK